MNWLRQSLAACTVSLAVTGALSESADAFEADVLVLECLRIEQSLIVSHISLTPNVEIDIDEQQFCADALQTALREGFGVREFIEGKKVITFHLPNPEVVTIRAEEEDFLILVWTLIRENEGINN